LSKRKYDDVVDNDCHDDDDGDDVVDDDDVIDNDCRDDGEYGYTSNVKSMLQRI
jgi:hypothetical protein